MNGDAYRFLAAFIAILALFGVLGALQCSEDASVCTAADIRLGAPGC